MTSAQAQQHEAWKAARERMARPAPQSRVALQQELSVVSQERDQARRDMVRTIAEIKGLKAQVAKRDDEIERLTKKIEGMKHKPRAKKDYPSVETIIAEVLANYPGITFEDIIARRKTAKLDAPRRHCQFEVHRQRPDMSFPDIARAFHRFHHTTVIHNVRKHRALMNGETTSFGQAYAEAQNRKELF